MRSLSTQQEYWDRQADTARFTIDIDHDRLCELLPSTGSILDLGCGYGRVLRTLHDLGFARLTGLDPSARMIDRARRVVPEATLDVIRRYPLAQSSDTYDAVLVVAVLTCIPDDEEQRVLIGEALRVARPGGLVLVSDLLLSDDPRNRERYAEGLATHGTYGVFSLSDGVIHRHHTREWITSLVAGLECLHHEELPVTTRHGNPARGFRFIGRKR